MEEAPNRLDSGTASVNRILPASTTCTAKIRVTLTKDHRTSVTKGRRNAIVSGMEIG